VDFLDEEAARIIDEVAAEKALLLYVEDREGHTCVALWPAQDATSGAGAGEHKLLQWQARQRQGDFPQMGCVWQGVATGHREGIP